MERLSYLIALSDHAVEGTRLGEGQAMSVYTHGLPAGAEDRSGQEVLRERLDTFLSHSEWKSGPVVLVLPTEAVSFRRLSFSFRDPRKIRQALPFELETELLGEVEAWAFDFEVVPKGDGEADVLVYLVEKATLQALLDACEAKNLDVRRITFSAQALASAVGPYAGRGFHLYAGSDEIFMVYIEEGRLQAITGLNGAPHQVLEHFSAPAGATPSQKLALLLGTGENGHPGGVVEESVGAFDTGIDLENVQWKGMEPEPVEDSALEGMSDGAPEEKDDGVLDGTSDEEPHDPPEAGDEIGDDGTENGETEAGGTEAGGSTQLHRELERVREEANRFLRLYRPGGDYEMRIAGLFAPYLVFKQEYGEIALNLDEATVAETSSAHHGVLAELVAGQLVQGRQKGINFFHRLGTWVAAFNALKWRLAVTSVLIFLLTGLWVAAYTYRSAGLEKKLAVVNTQLRQTLNIPPPLNSLSIHAALKKLREQRGKMEKARKASAYLEQYHYDALILLREVSKLLAQMPRMRVDSLTYNRERFTLAGGTPDYNDSENLKNRIGALPQFKGQEVKVSHSRTAQGILFRLSIQR